MPDSTISNLAAATSLQSTDLFTIVQAATNKKITASVLDSLRRWTIVPTDQYTSSPTYESYASGVWTAVPNWAADTAKSVGNYVKPTVSNGYIYECVAVSGDTKTDPATEPTWPTTYGVRVVDDAVTWECRGLSVLTTTSDLTANIAKGVPLKYAWGGTTYYGLCIDVSATRIAIAGAPLHGLNSLTALAYGAVERVVQLTLYKSGDYDAGVADITCGPQLTWSLGAARLVAFDVRHETNDTGANNPYTNVKVGVNVVSAMGNSAGADKGVNPTSATAWFANSAVAIKTSAYAVVRGDAIVPRTTVAGSNGDAIGLNVNLVFVLE
jgi:hypothetical protein